MRNSSTEPPNSLDSYVGVTYKGFMEDTIITNEDGWRKSRRGDHLLALAAEKLPLDSVALVKAAAFIAVRARPFLPVNSESYRLPGRILEWADAHEFKPDESVLMRAHLEATNLADPIEADSVAQVWAAHAVTYLVDTCRSTWVRREAASHVSRCAAKALAWHVAGPYYAGQATAEGQAIEREFVSRELANHADVVRRFVRFEDIRVTGGNHE